MAVKSEEEVRKIICDSFEKVQADLIIDTLVLYARKNYPEFWRALESLKTFLDVKEKLPCTLKK
jgi:hypothetical protein